MYFSHLTAGPKFGWADLDSVDSVVEIRYPGAHRTGSIGHWFYFVGDRLEDHNIVAEAVTKRHGLGWWVRLTKKPEQEPIVYLEESTEMTPEMWEFLRKRSKER